MIESWKDNVLEQQTVYRGPQAGENSNYPYVMEEITADGIKTISYHDPNHRLRKTKAIGGGAAGGTVNDIITSYVESYEQVNGIWCRKDTTTSNGFTSIRWTDAALAVP